MRIGLISPYSFDTPGGVQFHIKDLAENLQNRGHYVNVLAPAHEDTLLPDYVTSGGKAVPVRYNGSVARLSFGPRVASRTKRWLAENHFDLIHPHEPITPSLSMLGVWYSEVPVVATFHSYLDRSRSLQLAAGLLKSTLNKIDAKIAVSLQARKSLINHLGIDAQVIPNGVFESKYANASVNPNWTGELSNRPTIAFLGRLDESRKGLSVLVEAIPKVLSVVPEARFLIAGPGENGKFEAIKMLGVYAKNVTFLGAVTEIEKAQLLKSVDFFIAPQLSGESFGIVLIEAMSAGTSVIASDLPAFSDVLAHGQAGTLFPAANHEALTAAILSLINNRKTRQQRTDFASTWVRQFDWEPVTSQILEVYESVLDPGRLR